MRILVASPYLPWPLNSGGNAAQFSTLKCLANDHDFTLVCPIFTEAGLANARLLQAQLPRVNVRAVFCGSPAPVPRPNHTLLIRAARSVVRFGLRHLNPPAPEPVEIADSLGTLHYPFNPLPEKLISTLQDELSKGTDLCQAEFADMLPLGAWFPKELPTLFIHHQIHFIYARRLLETRARNPYSAYLDAVMRVQEIAYLKNFKGVLIFSEEDRQALLPYMSPRDLFKSPFPIPADVDLAHEIPRAFDGRFLFVASEEHDPNRDALDWLLAEIWPHIFQQLPSTRLVVVGNWSDSAQARLAAPGLTFAGFVSNLAAAVRGGIMLVPLRIGSGIRAKIMVALAQGVPVVSTPIGSEGLLLRDGHELLECEGASEFGAAAVELAKNTELWQRLATAGRTAISKHYSPEQVRRRRNEIYASLSRINAEGESAVDRQAPGGNDAASEPAKA